MPKNGKLTEKDKHFCRNYVASDHGTASYMRAFAVSYDTARSSASRLLAKDIIKDYIQQLRDVDKADHDIILYELRDRIIKTTKNNLELADLINDICTSKAEQCRLSNGTYNLEPNMFNAIFRGAESSSRLNKAARENLVLLAGLEALADEILNKSKS